MNDVAAELVIERGAAVTPQPGIVDKLDGISRAVVFDGLGFALDELVESLALLPEERKFAGLGAATSLAAT